MLQHKQDANTLEIVHLSGSSTLSPLVIEILYFLAAHLDGITTATYTADLTKKTEDRGDCCMMSIVEWGHNARLEYEDDISRLDDQDHMDFTGESTLRVNQTCLTSEHNIFMVAPTDRDAHNPILVHLKPLEMIWSEKRAYVPYEMKRRHHQKRRETQKANKRKGYDDDYWGNWHGTGFGGSSASSSRT